jgi:broad specificity phosphatase PhoE
MLATSEKDQDPEWPERAGSVSTSRARPHFGIAANGTYVLTAALQYSPYRIALDATRQAYDRGRQLEMPALLPLQPFYFLRHGQTDWNLQGRLQGHTDVPLNRTGLAQARVAADILANESIDIIVSSPLVRALKTAAIISERIDRPICIDSQLKERSFGPFEGQILADLKRSLGIEPYQRLNAYLPADAEQWSDTRVRARAAFGNSLAKFAPRKVLFVAHAGLFDALYEQLFGPRLEPNHEPYLFEPAGQTWKVGPLIGGQTMIAAACSG